jgi:Protein of unknown function (DUF1631)
LSEIFAVVDRFSLFSESRERMASALGEAVQRLLPTLLMVLSRNAERAIDLKARVELQEAHHELHLRKEKLVKDVVRRFNELVFKRLEIESNSPREDLAGGLLALLPEADLDEQIYADDLAQRIRAAGGEEYAALIHRAHVLTGFSHQEDRCPLSAGIFAAALIQALRSVTKDRLVWAALRPELSIDFPNDIAIAMADVNDYLRANKVLADMPRFIAKVEPTKPRIEPIEHRDAASTVANLGNVQGAARQDLSANGSTKSGTESSEAKESSQASSGGLMVRASSAVDQALTAARSASPHTLRQAEKPVQRALLTSRMMPIASLEAEGTAFANSVGLSAYSRSAREQFFVQLRQAIPKQQLDSSQGAVIDVVQSMFDYAVDDKQVPDAARPLLWRLQLPSVVLSLLDARYLGDQPNSVRRLIENLSAIVMAFPDDVFKGSELFTRLETAVRAVEVVSHTLQTRAGVLADLLDKQFGESAKGIAMIAHSVKAQLQSLESMPERRNRRDYRRRPSREAEAEVTEKLNLLLIQKLAGKEIPESVHQFLSTVWMRRLRTTALRDGQESQEFLVSLQVVDDLLWSLSDKNKRAERQQLAVQIPPLIKQLTHGVRSVGVDEKKLDSFFDELFLIHLRRMQREHLTLVAPPIQQSTLPTVIERANQRNQSLSTNSLSTNSLSTNSLNTHDAVQTKTAMTIRRVAKPIAAPVELKKPFVSDGLASQNSNDAEDADWPVLGTDLVLPEPSPSQFKDLQKISPKTELLQTKPQPTLSGKPSSLLKVNYAPSVPVIPAMTDLTPSQFNLDSINRVSLEKTMRTANATRVGLLNTRPPNKTVLGPVKISGMDQLAAAASINLLTIPGSPKKRKEGDAANRNVRSNDQHSKPINLDGMPDLPSLTMPGKSSDNTNKFLFKSLLTRPSLTGAVPAKPPAPAENIAQTMPQLSEWEASASERKLLELLETVDVSDGHLDYIRRDLGPDEAMDLLQVGTWLELLAGPDGSRFGKVAWVNDRRTVVLVVREGDRKAMSLRSGELLTRFSERRAFLLKPPVGTPQRDQR